MTFIKIALILIIVILIYQVIFQLWLCSKRSSFNTSTDTLTKLTKNEKNVMYMAIQNPYVVTTITEQSKEEDIISFQKDVAALQKFKYDVLVDLYSVDNFIKSVLINYNYTFDPSVTTLVDFSKESKVLTFQIGKLLWDLCQLTSFNDSIRLMSTENDLKNAYLSFIRPKNLIKNGQFSTSSTMTSKTWIGYSSTLLSNWSASGSVPIYNDVTTWNSIVPPTTTKQGVGIQGLSSLSQSIQLITGKTYVLYFSNSTRPGNRDKDALDVTLKNTFSYTNNNVITKTNPIEVSLIINGNKSIIGITLATDSSKWKDEFMFFDVPMNGIYTLTFTGLWNNSGNTDRSGLITDVIVSDITPFDYPSEVYKCEKPLITSEPSIKSINSTRGSLDVSMVTKMYSLYKVTEVTPTIVTELQSISPTQVLNEGGNSITLKGKNLNGATKVTIGSQAATSFVINSSTQITAVVPKSTSTTPVDIVVETPQGISTLTKVLTYVSAVSVAKFLNQGKTSLTDEYGNIVSKFTSGITQLAATPTDYVNKPINPYLNNYVKFPDGTYAFVMADGKVRRIGTQSDVMTYIQGKNGCPILNDTSSSRFTESSTRSHNSFNVLPSNDVKDLPVYNPPLVDGPKLFNGESCFTDGTTITYTNDYADKITNLDATGFDLIGSGASAGVAGYTVDQCKAKCTELTGCKGFVHRTSDSRCFPKSYLNFATTSNGIDMYRRKAIDQNKKDVTNANEVNPYINKFLYQKNTNMFYVANDGTYYDSWGKKENSSLGGWNTCPTAKPNETDGSVKWQDVGIDYTKLQFYSPSLKLDTSRKLTTGDLCVMRGVPNPLLKQYIRYKSGVMFYVQVDGIMRKIPTWYILESLSGKNACPLSSDYVQLDTDDYNVINTVYNFNPPLKLGTDLVYGDYCIAPTKNPLLDRFVQDTNQTYYYITTLGLVRQIPNKSVLDSIKGKNGCQNISGLTSTNFNETDKTKIILLGVDDYNKLGPYTPPLLPGTDMGYNDYCTGFTPKLTDISKLVLTTVTSPNYTGLYFENSIAINEVVLIFNGIPLILNTTMSESQRKEAIYTFILKNYF